MLWTAHHYLIIVMTTPFWRRVFSCLQRGFFIKIYFSRNQIHFFAGYNVRGEKPGKGVGECGMTEL